jgi:hypothetical protein
MGKPCKTRYMKEGMAIEITTGNPSSINTKNIMIIVIPIAKPLL